MGAGGGMTGVLLASLLAAPPSSGGSTEPLPFSPGVGYTVSQLLRHGHGAPVTAEAEAGSEAEPETTVSLVPRLPPPSSDLARIQTSPRARGLHAAAALVAQVAMIIAGAVAVRDQREQLRREREGQAPPYKFHR